VGFPCRIFISRHRRHHQRCLLVCCFFHPPTYAVPPQGGARLFIWLLHAIHAWLPAHNVLLLPWTNTATTKRPVACNLRGDLHASLLLWAVLIL
jgi:hypothetical protein